MAKQRTLFDGTDADRIANRSSNLESAVSDAPLGAKETPRFDSPVRIHVHNVRKRLADLDGISIKAVLDGLVNCGVLRTDSPEQVAAIEVTQSKGDQEKTIVTIETIKESKPGGASPRR